MPPIVVFDTNVLLSGVGWKGRPFKCLELARSGEVEAITCLEILSELAEKLTSKLSFATEQANDTILDLLGFLKLVSIDGTLKAVDADPDDDKDIGMCPGRFRQVCSDRRPPTSAAVTQLSRNLFGNAGGVRGTRRIRSPIVIHMRFPLNITSKQNPRIKDASRLRSRRERTRQRRYLIEGLREIERAAAT